MSVGKSGNRAKSVGESEFASSGTPLKILRMILKSMMPPMRILKDPEL